MPKPSPDIETGILVILQDGPIKQSEVGDHFPLERYLDIGYTVRDMAARGIITRTRNGATYILEQSDGKAHD